MTDYQKLDALNVLGLSFRQYSAAVKALALSKPSDYFALKQEALVKFENAIVEKIYKQFYELLKEGKVDGALIRVAVAGNTTGIPLPATPSFPSQKVNDIALEACSELSAIIEKAINILLPDDFSKIAEGNLSMKTKGGLIE